MALRTGERTLDCIRIPRSDTTGYKRSSRNFRAREAAWAQAETFVGCRARGGARCENLNLVERTGVHYERFKAKSKAKRDKPKAFEKDDSRIAMLERRQRPPRYVAREFSSKKPTPPGAAHATYLGSVSPLKTLRRRRRGDQRTRKIDCRSDQLVEAGMGLHARMIRLDVGLMRETLVCIRKTATRHFDYDDGFS